MTNRCHNRRVERETWDDALAQSQSSNVAADWGCDLVVIELASTLMEDDFASFLWACSVLVTMEA
jgi:hypothetical protein